MQTADIEALLAPLSAEAPCGADLEYGDPAFTALDRATQGKPEQQIGSTIVPAEEPDWKAVERQAQALLQRTKDLRIAVHLTKSLLHTGGVPGFALGLTFLKRLVEAYWEGVHPRLDPDDANDPTMRLNILATLTAADVVTAVRATPIISSRSMGRFSYKDVESAPADSGANGGGTSLATIEAAAMDCELGALEEQVGATQAGLAAVRGLEATLSELLGAGVAPSFGALTALLQKMAGFLQPILARRSPAAAGAASEAGDGLGTVTGGASVAGFSGQIRSREEVVKALEAISDYYARQEPSSPIPLLVERCKRLVRMGFMDIVRELVPEGVRQIEALSGQKQE
jgi:type VI secretion system protein ImpA